MNSERKMVTKMAKAVDLAIYLSTVITQYNNLLIQNQALSHVHFASGPT